METDLNVSAETPDWTRETIRHSRDSGPKLIRAVRRYQLAVARGGIVGRITAKYWVIVHSFWSFMTQSEIHLHMEIGGGLRLPHPTGIIVHPDVTLGPNVMIFHQVTLSDAVIVGGHVDIGAGAKIIGPLTIGDHARIGANAVVTRDVPAGATVVGIPAREI